MNRRTQPVYVSRSTKGEFTNALLLGAWFVVGVLVAVHEVAS